MFLGKHLRPKWDSLGNQYPDREGTNSETMNMDPSTAISLDTTIGELGGMDWKKPTIEVIGY